MQGLVKKVLEVSLVAICVFVVFIILDMMKIGPMTMWVPAAIDLFRAR